ncbi:MAG: 3-keto-5-aminohexanoate cleavage protein [Gemmatimonadetes bacterium]|nr:3-keto-5-aminohexanoate cleavage protein [Gemmatimonadota bacterium]
MIVRADAACLHGLETKTPPTELLINFCPTGLVRRERTPHVPLSPAQIVDHSCRALELGASIVHLHARGSDGLPEWRARAYEPMILGIRSHYPSAVIGVSCIGNDFPELERRSEVLELSGEARPDVASLALATFNLPDGANPNAPDVVVALVEKMARHGIRPELECFDFGMINALHLLIRRGLLSPPFHGEPAARSRYTVPATARHLSALVEDLPPQSIWAAAGIGLFQAPMNLLALAMGGHCRVGLEDNLYLDFDRRQLATNTELVTRVVKLADAAGRPLASHARARELLGLQPRAPHPTAAGRTTLRREAIGVAGVHGTGA